jgi:hypothetical protein
MTEGSSARDDVVTRRDLLRIVRGAIARGDLPPEAEQEAVDSLGAVVKRFALTRRDLLKATAATAGLTLVAVDAFTHSAEAKSILAATPSLTASVLRRDDMLALRFDFYNLTRNTQGDLVRQNAAQPAYIVATPGYGADYAPQNIAEQAFLEATPPLTPRPALPGAPPFPTEQQGGEDLIDPGTVQARLAGASRLAFRVPDYLAVIPFTVSSLLDFTRFQLNVAPAALPPLPAGTKPSPLPAFRAPDETETAIESPWHLIVSPHAGMTFANALLPVVRSGRTELWHSRLAVRKQLAPAVWAADETDGTKSMRTIRALWATDVDYASPPAYSDETPFRMSLKKYDRYQITRLSSDFSFTLKSGAEYYEPKTIDVDKLILSALGAWHSTRGYFAEPPLGFNLGEWKHIATMARDQYVKVVYLGWLLPFGHTAALIKVTERKIQPPKNMPSVRAAYLRQRFFIVVRRPIVDYPDASPQPDDGRGMPYRSVEIKTTVTPTLDNPAEANWSFFGLKDLAFIPVVGTRPFEFSIRGTDRDGQTSEFTMPLAFVSYPVGTFTMNEVEDVVNAYTATTNCPNFTADMKKATLGGQKVGMTPSTKNEDSVNGKPGDSALEVKDLTWKAEFVTVPYPQTPFYPEWEKANVRLDGVEQVSGNDFGGVPIKPHDTYLAQGFSTQLNPGAVFAQVTTPPKLSFTDATKPAVDRAGGLANLDMSIGGLSRSLGPVGGDTSAGVPTQFEPEKFFPDAKILGGIFLKDIILPIVFDNLAKVPKMVTNTIYPGGDTTKLPEAVETTVNFVPDLSPDPLGIFDPDSDNATMTIDAKFRTPIDPPDEPTYEIVGDLRNFRVTLIGKNLGLAAFITLMFNQLKFTTKSGNKPNVDVDIREVKFEGVLAFVNSLKDYLKLGNTGPSIDIQPTSVTAGFSIGIPTVGVGVLTIQNIAFGAGVMIPFTGNPARVRFNFCEREDPFLVTVMGLGGGGFFGIAVGFDGVEIFEMSIEVGASVALNLGVASGEVHAMAGFYYKLEKKTQAADPNNPDKPTTYDEIQLEAYIRLGGSVNVLGIASVSVEFYLGLKHENPPNELWGQASLTVEVEVLCFSKSFSFTVERRIAGGSDSASAMTGILAAATGGSKLASLTARTKPLFNITDLMNQDEWDAYAGAFATA